MFPCMSYVCVLPVVVVAVHAIFLELLLRLYECTMFLWLFRIISYVLHSTFLTLLCYSCGCCMFSLLRFSCGCPIAFPDVRVAFCHIDSRGNLMNQFNMKLIKQVSVEVF